MGVWWGLWGLGVSDVLREKLLIQDFYLYDISFSGQISVRYIYPSEVLPECSMYMSKQYYMITNQHKKNLLECARKFRKSDGIFQ